MKACYFDKCLEIFYVICVLQMARTPCKVVIKRSRDPCAQTEDWKQLQEAVWQDELRKTEQTPPSITTSSPPPENTDGKNGCDLSKTFE